MRIFSVYFPLLRTLRKLCTKYQLGEIKSLASPIISYTRTNKTELHYSHPDTTVLYNREQVIYVFTFADV